MSPLLPSATSYISLFQHFSREVKINIFLNFVLLMLSHIKHQERMLWCGICNMWYLIGLGTKVVTYMSPPVSPNTDPWALKPFINLIIFNFIPCWKGHTGQSWRKRLFFTFEQNDFVISVFDILMNENWMAAAAMSYKY